MEDDNTLLDRRGDGTLTIGQVRTEGGDDVDVAAGIDADGRRGPCPSPALVSERMLVLAEMVAKGEPVARLASEIRSTLSELYGVRETGLVIVSDQLRSVIGPTASAGVPSPEDLQLFVDQFRITSNGYFKRSASWLSGQVRGVPENEADGPSRTWQPRDWLRFAMRDRSGEILAYLDVSMAEGTPLPSKQCVESIGALAAMVSFALGNELDKLAKETDSTKLLQRTDLLEDVLKISSSIVSEKDLGKLSDMALSSLSTLFGFERITLVVYDESVGAFRWSAFFGYPEQTVREYRTRTIPIDVIMEDLRESRRIGRAAYFTPLEDVSPRQLSYYVQPEAVVQSTTDASRDRGEFRAGDCLGFALHDSSGRVVGVIYPSGAKDEGMPDRETIETIEIFTSLVEVALENARLAHEKETALRMSGQRTEQLSRIFDLTSDILYVRDLDHLLEDVLRTLAQLLGLKRMVLGMRDDAAGVFKIRAVHGYSDDRAEAIRKIEYPIGRVEHIIDPTGRPIKETPVKWRKKVGRTTYYMPTESVQFDDSEMAYYPEPWLVRVPRKGEGYWHELDYMDTFIFSREGVVVAYIEILKPRDDRIPDQETVEVIEIFGSIVGIAIENATMFQSQIESRHSAEFYTDLLSHDIKNFNQAIMGYLDMLRTTLVRPDQVAMISKLTDQVMGVNMLASSVRTMSRLTWGEVKLTRVDIGPVLEDCVRSVQHYFMSRKVVVRHDDWPARAYTLADELLRELFVNILTNAVKYDPHEPVEVDVSVVEATDGARPSWVVSFADRGHGVPDDIKGRIFERFAQGSRKKGSGLGLSIVRMLVQRYHGRVWVEDRVKGDHTQGAVFKVELPKAE